jgi:putative aminopeptidase FrvX
MELLKKLISIQGASSDEEEMKNFILSHIEINKANWKIKPKIIQGRNFQDCIILIFGEPKTAIYAHIDTIGFSVSHTNKLIPIGGPELIDGTILVGKDSIGEIETELLIIETETNQNHLQCILDRNIEPGTILTFKPNFINHKTHIQTPYLDNRLGVWNTLKLAENLEHGAIVFSTYEEHGGNSVAFCAKYLYNTYNITQALISDITWTSSHIHTNKGVVISLRDGSIPRRSYLKKIISLAKESGVPFQLEVESSGGSDGSYLQNSELPIDWCFIGAACENIHTPTETVSKKDIKHMLNMYAHLIKNL